MISLHRSMHSSQMYTPGPAINFLTCFWLFPQKEHFSRSPPSPIRAMRPSFSRSDLGPTCFSIRHRAHDKFYDRTPRSHSPVGDTPTRQLPAGADRSHCLAGLEDGVDEAVLQGRVRGEDLVALDV